MSKNSGTFIRKYARHMALTLCTSFLAFSIGGCASGTAGSAASSSTSQRAAESSAAGDAVSGAMQEPTINWRDDVTQKYQNDPNVRQLVTVQYVGGYDCKVMMFEKSDVNGKSVWSITLTCDGILGKNGLGKTKEGDLKTPVGDFGITEAFGIKENPGTSLPYVDVDENTYCCGDENFYNQIIDISEHPHDCADGEHLIEYTPEYNYGMFLDYNAEGAVGLGSAIFFHCTGAKNYTGGCIAVEEENMVTILKALESGARVIIDYVNPVTVG